jgi:hypothetical protein
MAPIALKRLLLNSMIASLVVTAFCGVMAILFNLGDFGLRVTLTTLVVSSVSIVGLPPAIQLERKKHRELSFAALGSTAAGAILLLMSIWLETGGENHLRLILTFWIASCTLSMSCLLLLGTLTNRFKVVQVGAILLAVALAGQFIWSIWANQELSWQVVSIVALLFTTSSLAVPVLHRLSALPGSGNSVDPGSEATVANVSCPSCGCSIANDPLGNTCGCGCKFTIQVMGRDKKTI